MNTQYAGDANGSRRAAVARFFGAGLNLSVFEDASSMKITPGRAARFTALHPRARPTGITPGGRSEGTREALPRQPQY